MATPNADDRFREAGQRASETRRAAYQSYSQAANLVRERLVEVESALRSDAPLPQRERLNEALSVALRMKELTERELQNADENWREWVEEDRARREESRLARQEKATTSAAWAAWGSAVAAAVSAFIAVWQVLHPGK